MYYNTGKIDFFFFFFPACVIVQYNGDLESYVAIKKQNPKTQSRVMLGCIMLKSFQ